MRKIGENVDSILWNKKGKCYLKGIDNVDDLVDGKVDDLVRSMTAINPKITLKLIVEKITKI